MTLRRLHPSTLDALPAAVARPRYERAALQAGIVHLGAGAFQRAHLAAATEAALHANGDLRWGIAGVSLRRADTHDALAPQGGLYTLSLRDADAQGAARERLQLIGAMPRLLVAPDDPGAVLDAIAHPHTRIVSLTVTEKGYHHDPATGALRRDDPDIRHDLVHADAPRTMLGFLVHGLARRRARGLGPLTLLSCDNLPANGRTLQGLVHAFASELDRELAAWIASGCTFPNSMVDRIVPRTTDADRARIAGLLGVEDAWPVVGEPFFEWVIEDRFAAGRPDWAAGGARFVADAEPFERLKLRMVNGSHSMIAYLGAMAGWATVDRAIAEPALRRVVDATLRDEIAPTLPPLPGLDLEAWRAGLLQRFANPALQHRTQQIAMDGSQKLPQRLLGTLRDRLRTQASIDGLALAVAAWIHYLRGVDEAGAPYPIQDPLAPALAQQLALADRAASEAERIALFCRFAPVFGDLGEDARLIQALARHTRSLRERGVRATLDDFR
jgi:fructuronate reductase